MDERRLAYAICYADNGEFLIADKRGTSYYFPPSHRNHQQGSVHYPPVDIGRGSYVGHAVPNVFPGGGLKLNEAPQAGAAREFEEETGIPRIHLPVPDLLNYKYDDRLDADVTYSCWACYFRLDRDTLHAFQRTITDTHLAAAQNLIVAIQSPNAPIRDYATLRNNPWFNSAPLDNELSAVRIESLMGPDLQAMVKGWSYDSPTHGWFRPMVEDLWSKILGWNPQEW